MGKLKHCEEIKLFGLSVWARTRAANDPSVFIITEKAPTKAFSWLKASRGLAGAISVIVKIDGSLQL